MRRRVSGSDPTRIFHSLDSANSGYAASRLRYGCNGGRIDPLDRVLEETVLLGSPGFLGERESTGRRNNAYNIRNMGKDPKDR